MPAFGKNGEPLVLDWLGMDSSKQPSYAFLYDWDGGGLEPDQTENIRGGWSLNITGRDANVEKIAYILYCDKQIAFSDGTVWKNPAYDAWYHTYCGKTVPAETLDAHYPFVHAVS